MSPDFECSCRTRRPGTIPPDATAAYCTTCLGWLKRPLKMAGISERQRIEVLKVPREKPVAPVKSHRGGRPKLQDGCSKGHASWAWVKDRRGRRRCRLCERQRKALSRKGAA